MLYNVVWLPAIKYSVTSLVTIKNKERKHQIISWYRVQSQPDRQTDKDRQAGRQAGRHTLKQTNKETNKGTKERMNERMSTYIHICVTTCSHIYSWTDWQRDRWTNTKAYTLILPPRIQCYHQLLMAQIDHRHLRLLQTMASETSDKMCACVFLGMGRQKTEKTRHCLQTDIATDKRPLF